eukprot:4996767-Pyramimonas_sp.AAC.1
MQKAQAQLPAERDALLNTSAEEWELVGRPSRRELVDEKADVTKSEAEVRAQPEAAQDQEWADVTKSVAEVLAQLEAVRDQAKADVTKSEAEVAEARAQLEA